MLPNTILEVTEENTKHFKCVSIPMFMQIMQMSLRVSHSLHLPYPFALQECLSHDAQQQYENTNASKKELKLTKTFSIPSFEKVKIKLSNISDPVVKNLSTKLRIVGFRGACVTLKCSLNFCWISLIDFWFQHKTMEFSFFDLYCCKSSCSAQMVIFCAIWVTRIITLGFDNVQWAVKCDRCTALCATTP